MSLIRSSLSISLLLLLSFACVAQNKNTAAIKGKVRVEKGSAAGVAVVLLQGEREVMRTVTGKGGDFVLSRVQPGTYSVKFRKPGLSVGTIDDVSVKAGQTRTLGDHLFLTIDEGSIAFIRGSVFTEDGRSVPGARIDLVRVIDEKSVQKLDSRMTGETGEFVFRLPPNAAKYRLTLKADGAESVSKDVDVESAAVYRVALTYKKKS
ncbi:MAG TPA: carboxypeptidase-like regulatory domain-containing protein [Pyrinomonadaceae bacterium]|nr:carboxypeptidase-like regulatory domain-containing protein [Pyrinomonadaceae bacterium]